MRRAKAPEPALANQPVRRNQRSQRRKHCLRARPLLQLPVFIQRPRGPLLQSRFDREYSLNPRLTGHLNKSKALTKKHRKTSRRIKAITEDLPVEMATGIPMEGRPMDEHLVEPSRE
jgi:hypothetical protein